MANSKKCLRCGANLDFGEKCTCNVSTESREGNENGGYYRIFPEFGEEQKLDALSAIKEMLG